jgi:2-haloacid dehalogenase
MMDKVPAPHPEAVLFDAYGTLFDVYSVALAAEQLFAGQGAALAQGWRDKQIEYTRLVSMSGRYRPFWDLTRAALRFTAQRLDLPLPRAAEDRLMNEYRHLSAFPENGEVLRTLRARGIRAGILRDRKSTRLNSSHRLTSRMPSSA